ncbi:MAG: TetR/AcrR family transcriptional regulator [Pseudomonadales bacterium]|nr:TetR/AcrR family transcriptional regulator [Pseudomonadales bacterium]
MDSVNMVKTSNYHRGDLREKILQTAFELLDDEGIEAVGIRKIARALEVAHSAPANHFQNKQSLLTALATESFRYLVSKIEKEISKETGNLRLSIHSFSNTILKFGLEYPNRYKLLWRREYADDQDGELGAAMDNIYAALTAILGEHAKNKQVDVESQAIALWSLVHGYVLLRLDGNLKEGNDEVTGIKRQVAIIDVLIDGIIE